MRQRLLPVPRGFTLIELMVSIAVIVVILSLAAPSFQKLIASQRIKNASFDLFSALNYARSEAVKRNANISLKSGAAVDGAWTTGWRIEDATPTILRSWSGTSNLSVSENSSVTTVTYGRDGRLTTAAPVFKISSSISGVALRCITADLSGRANTQIKTGTTCP